ncbi:MAG: glycosyltransferase family 39 protein [Gemmatimonadetes bacterium]|nr:glycosyltransferase family 39 protein [Gemmatimonadota bacterium]
MRRSDTVGAVLAVIAIGAVARFLLAATVGLGVDESYAVAVARQFSLSYFDHPPLHFWIAGAAAKLARSEMGEVVRFPFVLCFAGTTWFMYSIGRRLFGDRAGLYGIILLNVSAVFSLSTGGWVLPDGPLMLFMAAAADRISVILFDDTPAPAIGAWCVAGLLTGLAMLSKYHGAFILAGTFAFIVSSSTHRRWLATPGPYIATAIAFAFFAPVIIWNSQHGWASFAFQGARAGATSAINLGSFLANIGGQMAWVLPWIFVPLAASVWRAVRGGPGDERRWFLLCLAAGPIAIFTLVSLRGNPGLPHWQAPGWLFAFPMLGAAVGERLDRNERRTKRWLRWSVWGYVGLIALLTTHASTGWMARIAPEAFSKGDPSGDLVTWSRLLPALAEADFDPATDFVAATSWIQAGKAAVGAGPRIPVLCLCADPHHFFYAYSDSAYLGRNAIIVHKVRAGDDVIERFAPYFERIEPLTEFAVMRGPQDVMAVELFRATNFRALYPTTQQR